MPKLSDSLTYLYVDKAIIERDLNAVVVIRQGERIPLPISALTVLMLGPGTNVTHAAMQAIADNGCLVTWCGENATRFYGYGMGETRSAANLLRQAEYCMDEKKHLTAVRRMYQLRFPDMDLSGKSLEQMRGYEGIRVRETYKLLSRKYNIPWTGRLYDKTEWDASNDVNKALSMGNVCLYGLCNAAIISLGYSPGLGFIHTGKMTSFVYDIADLYKLETTVPLAFEIATSPREDTIERTVRRRLRPILRQRKVLKRIASDIAYIFADDPKDDVNQEDVGDLWDGNSSTVNGGCNYAEVVDDSTGS